MFGLLIAGCEQEVDISSERTVFVFFFVSLNICFLCVSVWQQLHLSVFLSYWWNKVVCCWLNHFYCRDTVSSVGCGEKNRQSSRCDDGESLVLSFSCGTYARTHTHTHTHTRGVASSCGNPIFSSPPNTEYLLYLHSLSLCLPLFLFSNCFPLIFNIADSPKNGWYENDHYFLTARSFWNPIK